LQSFERYLQLASNPDQRVAGWVKELRGRVGGSKPDAPDAPATQPASPAATESNANPPGSAGQVTGE
jgi:hypothetical protein